MSAEPVWVPCEGSGCPPAASGVMPATCSMCGVLSWVLTDDGNVPGHQRDDVLARMDRGDFG